MVWHLFFSLFFSSSSLSFSFRRALLTAARPLRLTDLLARACFPAATLALSQCRRTCGVLERATGGIDPRKQRHPRRQLCLQRQLFYLVRRATTRARVSDPMRVDGSLKVFEGSCLFLFWKNSDDSPRTNLFSRMRCVLTPALLWPAPVRLRARTIGHMARVTPTVSTAPL